MSTTCTNSANPGFDHFVTKQLGLRPEVEKILLHGIGCSGGLAAIRTAANLALGSSFRKKPARVLVLACEMCTPLVRSELDSIHKEQKTRIGACLFSDCASAAILSNNFGEDEPCTPIYQLLGWRHEILPDTDTDLGFDVDPLGMAQISLLQCSFQRLTIKISQAGKSFSPLASLPWPPPPFLPPSNLSSSRFLTSTSTAKSHPQLQILTGPSIQVAHPS